MTCLKLDPADEAFRLRVREFAAAEIAPLVQDAERHETMPRAIFSRLAEAGLLGVRYPRSLGGLGAGKVQECIWREELARVSQGFAAAISAHAHLGTYPLFAFGTPEQQAAFLVPALKGKLIAGFALTEPDAGSDVGSLRTHAVKHDGRWVLNGTKMFITNAPIADYLVVAAYTDRTRKFGGISLFVVETRTPGFRVAAKLRKEGIRASETGELVLDECSVPLENLIGGDEGGYARLRETLVEGRVSVAANCVGMAISAVEQGRAALLSARGRVTPDILATQRERLAAVAARVEAARWLVYRAAWQIDRGEFDPLAASMAKLYASETAVLAGREALLGAGSAAGDCQWPGWQPYRDALVYTVGEGTSEIQRWLIGKQLAQGGDRT